MVSWRRSPGRKLPGDGQKKLKKLGQMKFKNKIFNKILGLILAVLLFINPLVVPLVYAEGEEGVTPTPQSTITTGDADASSTTDTIVNNNQDTIDGNISTPPGSCSPPEGQTSCPDDITIDNNNQATVSAATDSSADTGDNQSIGGSGDATIDTGDATASGQMTNDINSNTVVATSSPEPSQTSSGSPEDLNVTNENNGDVKNSADVSANTGENLASENLGDVDLKTGDALAWLNLLNFLNTNIVGSDFEVLYLDIKDDSNGEINLNEIWKELQARNGSDSLSLVGDPASGNLRLIIKNTNNANLENNVNVCATTGDNQANQNNSVQIETGDATALANIINMVNANILGSKFFFGIINITGQFKGNLILPRPERFIGVGSSAIGGAGAIFENQNFASVADSLSASASTGGNQENNNGGDNTINTGDAEAAARDLSLINLNLYQNDWFYLLMNILGSWNGKTYGWSNPGMAEEATEQSQAYEIGNQSSANVGSTSPVDFQNQNTANVKNDISVSASTGDNQANGNTNGASIKTGKAKAVLNLLNLINLNILASRWFMGLVNVLGSWSGNTIFAYPDLVVSLSGSPDEVSPGDSFEYVLNFGNQGYDDAEDVSVKMDFPRGLLYEGDDSGVPANCNSQNCTWDVGNLKRSQGGSFRIKVKLDPNFLSISQVSFWQKLIPKVYAAENGSSFIVKALITTTVPESDNNNNVYERLTGVKAPADSAGEVDFGSDGDQESGIDQRQPVLEITAKNNVNGFVYPGDTVTFEITVKNSGDVRSKDTYLTQRLYNGVPEDLGVADINIGTIEPGRTAKVSFGIALADGEEFHAGSYHTITKAIGYAPNGSEVSSNEARTGFNVRFRFIAQVEAVIPEELEGQVLGAAAEFPGYENKNEKEILPYVLLFLLSSAWLIEKNRNLLKEKELYAEK